MNEPQVSETVRWEPTRMEALREFRVEIEFLSIGCVVRVGCKSVPFSTVKEAMIVLNEYVANPIETRKVWDKIFSQEEEL